MNVVMLGAGVAMMSSGVVMSIGARRQSDPAKSRLFRLAAIFFVVAGATIAISASIVD